MDAMQLLHTRYSALKLGEPAPSAQAVRAMLESAARVPGSRPTPALALEEFAQHWTGEHAKLAAAR